MYFGEYCVNATEDGECRIDYQNCEKSDFGDILMNDDEIEEIEEFLDYDFFEEDL